MTAPGAKRPPSGLLNNREALHELLVAAITLSLQADETDVAEHVMDALRVLHREEGVQEGAANAGFS